MTVLDAVGRSLGEAWWMFFDTFWALVLGFALSGAVRAFVSRSAMRRALGDHRAASVGRAGFLGMVSSSCSYAATALAKTLFVGGADFTAAMVFMFASTNLVIELGIVLWLLLGWQFALAELVGGAIMIVLLALVLPRVVSPRQADAARDRLASQEAAAAGQGAHGEGATGGHDHGGCTRATGGHDHHGGSGQPGEAVGRPARAPAAPAARVRSAAGWADAAGYTVGDVTMLRKEILIGFVVAGFLAELVPTSWWQALFVTGHGPLSSLENVVLGPFLAMISFVCSVGNAPLAAALWQGGITFGGTIAFVFADLIALPMLLIYRRYYGAPLTLRLLAVFWGVMSAAGLATEYLFRAAGLVPTTRPATIADTHLGLNATTMLDLVALAAAVAIYLLYRCRGRFLTDPPGREDQRPVT